MVLRQRVSLQKNLWKLQKNYGVDMAKDVVTLICDGASVIRAVARQLQKEDWTQFCVVHGFHLAVCDLLYLSPFAVVNRDEQDCDSDDDDQEYEGYLELNENMPPSPN